MVEMVEILDGRLGKHSVERVRYVINNLLHLVIVKYGDISHVLCISTRLRLVTILSLLIKYLVILHADPCNKSYISREISIEHPSVGLASLAESREILIEHPSVGLASLAQFYMSHNYVKLTAWAELCSPRACSKSCLGGKN